MEPIAPALLGSRFTADGTEWEKEVVLPAQVGFTLDRKHLIIRYFEREHSTEIPKGVVTADLLRDALAEAQITPSDEEVAAWVASMNTALHSDRSFKRGSEIRPRKKQWLWLPYLPLREVTLLAGDGGVGKSRLSWRIATHVTTGEAFPDDWKPTAASQPTHLSCQPRTRPTRRSSPRWKPRAPTWSAASFETSSSARIWPSTITASRSSGGRRISTHRGSCSWTPW